MNQDYMYYQNYQLDDTCRYELTNKQKEFLGAGILIVDKKITIRQAEKETLLPKSTIHYYIHHFIKETSFELYQCIVRQLKENIQNRNKRNRRAK